MAESHPLHSANEKFTDGIKPQWWPRVPPGKIRRLYANDALGLVDEELIDDVGTSLLLRCQSILVANDAHGGRAACPRCNTSIRHTRNKHERIICPVCSWQTLWAYYAKTFEGQGLLGVLVLDLLGHAGQRPVQPRGRQVDPAPIGIGRGAVQPVGARADHTDIDDGAAQIRARRLGTDQSVEIGT